VLAWRKWVRNVAMENEIYLLAAWFVVMRWEWLSR
jgi:hypothetical protein